MDAGMGGGKAARAGIAAAGVHGSGRIMQATTRARAIVARVIGMRDTIRPAATPTSWIDGDYPTPDWGVWRREPYEDGPGGEG
jgi:hypothetical protein